MNFSIVTLTNEDLTQYKVDMQEAFQKGFEDVFGKTEDIILPERDINHSLKAKGSVAYKAVVDGEMVGGAIVVIDEEAQHNHLDLFYVKCGIHSKGIGKRMWDEIEKLHQETKVWETCTLYFERRNIHFYVNRCGFHIVEFLNEKNHGADMPEDFIGDRGQGMFVFRKQM